MNTNKNFVVLVGWGGVGVSVGLCLALIFYITLYVKLCLPFTNVYIDYTGRYILPTGIRTRTHLLFRIDKKCICITAW